MSVHAYASFDDPQMESNRDIATYIGIVIDLGPHMYNFVLCIAKSVFGSAT